MKNDQYFEAIVQVRNPHKEAEDLLVQNLKGQISDIQKVRNGFDYYVKDKKKAENAARTVRDTYGGEFNVAASLHTVDKQTSKELYRLNVLIRLPDFKPNDVIAFDGKILQITGLGKKMTGRELRSGKVQAYNYPDNYEKLERQWTRVVQKKPEVEVLHPETYQSTRLQNKPKKELQVDEKVRVVEYKSGLWLV